MPAPIDVRVELADILTQVQGCEPDAVRLDSKLKDDLGVDSITIVEIGEELGRRFDLYLSDDTIDGFVTVQDAINAVVHHDGASAEKGSPPVPAKLATPTPPAPAPVTAEPTALERVRARDTTRRPLHDPRVRAAGRLALWMAIVGAGLGVLIGMGGAAVVGATGLGPADLPALSRSTTEATEPTSTPTPSDVPTSGTPSPDPTLNASSVSVAPGERFSLAGAFPALPAGQVLKVQVKDPGGVWDEFPVDTKTKAGGAFSTQIYTSRTGKRAFRMFHEATSKASPSVTVEIG